MCGTIKVGRHLPFVGRSKGTMGVIRVSPVMGHEIKMVSKFGGCCCAVVCGRLVVGWGVFGLRQGQNSQNAKTWVSWGGFKEGMSTLGREDFIYMRGMSTPKQGMGTPSRYSRIVKSE